LCSQSGAIALYLQKKDAFYQNQSHWIDNRPVIHIMPHWNFEGMEGEEILMRAYTNCDETELYLNGKSLGKRKVERYGHADWKVPYEKGVLRVVGRNSGEDVIYDEVKTSQKAISLKLKLENTVNYANGRDLAIITCYCVDNNGIMVFDAEPFIHFDTNQYGKIVGTGSDITDHIPPKESDRRMRAGLCAVAVKVGKELGELKVYARADGMKTAILKINLS